MNTVPITAQKRVVLAEESYLTLHVDIHIDNMKSYLSVYFNTDGEPPSEVASRLGQLGFTPAHGNYDFIYHWDRVPTVQDALDLVDGVHSTLKDMGVMFRMETTTPDDEE